MYDVTPSSVNMSDLASPKSDIPRILAIQSIVVEYSEEYVIIKSRGFHWVPGCSDVGGGGRRSMLGFLTFVCGRWRN